MIDHKLDATEVKDFLNERSFRATPQRLAIYDAAWCSGSHPTVECIHEQVKKRDPTISPATVYKTLQLFTEIGLVREMGFRNESTRYDPDMQPHINMICTECGAVEDYDMEELEDIVKQLEQNEGFNVISQRFEVYGLCSSCRKE